MNYLNFVLIETLENSNMNYLDRLITNCEKAKKAEPINEFILTDAENLKKISKCIYVIKQTSGDIYETFEQFKIYKSKKKRSCSSKNMPSEIMYVGSSTTGVYNRIKQHKGEGYKGTYALHLSHWFKKGNYQITIMEYDEPIEVIQLIEDNLSDQLKPAFGKLGGNNKS